MFHDYAKIYVKGGDGGNGVVAFRREKYVPMGGPAGGDGGGGGSIIIIGDPGLRTLTDFKYKRHYKAERGQHGQGKGMHGAKSNDLILKVPLGTVIRDASDNSIIADIIDTSQRVIAAKGGRGGKGNIRFANAFNKAPQIAENGEPGVERWLILELKLLADIGLIGMPNAGKSTLISKATAARPKIANYPFTTLDPNLGVVELTDGESFVIADLPGLVKGAASGVGLGHRFLRHVERTRVLVHVLDMSPRVEGDVYDDYLSINEEIALYSDNLRDRVQIIAANKMDMPGADEELKKFKENIKEEREIYPLSAITGEGLEPLLWRMQQLLQELPEVPLVKEDEIKQTVVRDTERFTIERDSYGIWLVNGSEPEKLIKMTNLENDDAVLRLQRIFNKMGLEDALISAGVKPGDTVRIGEVEFEYSE